MAINNETEQIRREIEEHRDVVLQSLDRLIPDIAYVVSICLKSLADGGKLLFIGNGGSACDAQHIAAEFVVKLRQERSALSALALVADNAILTSAGNDFGFESIFSRQIEALGKAQDVLFAISTSGNSANVLRAVETAKKMGIEVVALTGDVGGELSKICNNVIKVPSSTTARIQEMHIMIGHIICAEVERNIFADIIDGRGCE